MKNKILSLSSLLAAIAAFVSQPASHVSAQSLSGPQDQEPKALSKQAPDYAYQLRRDDIEGRVVVAFDITPSGDVANEKVVSATEPRLVKPTIRALSKWKYQPAIRGGVPVASRVIETVDFTLPENSR
jgi:protein TonB